MQTYKMWIAGEWVSPASGETFPTFNPATGEEIARIPLAGKPEVDKAVAAAGDMKRPERSVRKKSISSSVGASTPGSTSLTRRKITPQLGPRRKEAIVITKINPARKPGPNNGGLSRKHIVEGCNASLKRLGTDYIDLYEIHEFDKDTRFDGLHSA
jgi:hypothetical protein